jgi:UDP-N-acetylmuramoyl-tripeptide--D-alanyl-D-alanine ligase
LNIETLYQLFLTNPSVQTDTRKILPGDIFFALSGPTYNGNDFAIAALQAGASFAIVSIVAGTQNKQLIVVDDVLETLQQLAKFHRKQFSIPFIAITGSNGKTTTKELVNAVLATHYTTYTTQGNLNNHIGIPLTLLRVRKDAELAVIEMGANHQKEIAGYCEYVMPTHGIITNCGKAHLEGFGGVEGVRKGKGELYDYLRQNNGTALVYNGYNYLLEMSKGIPQFTYGIQNADVMGEALAGEPFLHAKLTSPETFEVATQLVGAYNLPNVLCAAAAGFFFGVPPQKIKRAIEDYEPDNSRSQMLVKGTNHIILDAYNANPTSMALAIENLGKIHATQKVVMLGAMMELGEESLWEHQQIIELLKKYQWKNVVLVGGDFAAIDQPYLFLRSSTEAAEWYTQQQFEQATILVKGSRSMKMEKVVADAGM